MKLLILFFVLLLPFPAFALPGKLIGSAGIEFIEHKWGSGGDPFRINAIAVTGAYSLPVYNMSSQSALFIAPGLRAYRGTHKKSSTLTTGEPYDLTVTAFPYFVGGNVGLQYSSSALNFDVFGLYYHGLGGSFEYETYFSDNDYTNTVEYEYKSHSEMGGGVRVLFPWKSSIAFGIEATYFVANIHIKDIQPKSEIEDKPTETGLGIKLSVSKRM